MKLSRDWWAHPVRERRGTRSRERGGAIAGCSARRAPLVAAPVPAQGQATAANISSSNSVSWVDRAEGMILLIGYVPQWHCVRVAAQAS